MTERKYDAMSLAQFAIGINGEPSDRTLRPDYQADIRWYARTRGGIVEPMQTRLWTLRLVLGLCGCLMTAISAQSQDPFKSVVRPSEPLTPAQEQKMFQLPPGFEIQLVASEPEILKPINLAFDAKGRLWVTDSTEYPIPAPAGRKGRDTIKILEDTNGDGRADKISVFADGLNIPMGIYPYRGGAIAFSIPHIWHLQDTDGDGKADKREKLYGPMGYERDTHGMNNAFRRGPGRWFRC